MSLRGGFMAETRMVLRHTLFRLGLTVSLVLTVFWHYNSLHSTSWALSAGLAQDYQVLLGAVAVLMGALVAARERAQGVVTWLDSLPYERSGWLTGKFLGGYGPVLLMTLFNLLLLALLQWGTGGAPVRWWVYGQHALVFLAPTLLFFYSLGYASGRLVPNARLAYLVALVLWVVVYPLLDPVWARTSYLLAGLMRVLPVDRVSDYAAIIGYGPDWPLILYHRIVYVALSGLMLLVAVTHAVGFSRRVTASFVAVTLLMGTGGGAYALAIGVRQDHYQTEWAGLPVLDRDHYRQIRWDELGQPVGPGHGFDVMDYELEVELDLAKGWLQGSVRMLGVNQGTVPLEELVFTLRRNFVVGSVTDRSGQPLDYRREADTLMIRLPSVVAGAGEMELYVHYAGVVEHWRGDRGQLHRAYHIAPDSVYLPSSYGWYPVAGEHVLAHVQTWEYGGRVHERIADGSAFHRPCDIEAVIRGAENLVVVGAQEGDAGRGVLLTASQSPGLSVMAAPYAKTVSGPITVYHHPDVRCRAETLAGSLHDLAAFYGSLLQTTHEFGLVVAQSPLGATAMRLPAPLDLALIADTALCALHESGVSLQILLDLAEPVWFYRSTPWGNVRSYLDFGVTSFLHALYRAHLGGQEHWQNEWSYRLGLEDQGLQGGERQVAIDRDIISGRHFCYDSNRIWLLLASVKDQYGEGVSLTVAHHLLKVDPARGLVPGELEALVESLLP